MKTASGMIGGRDMFHPPTWRGWKACLSWCAPRVMVGFQTLQRRCTGPLFVDRASKMCPFFKTGSLLLESKINPNTAYQKQQVRLKCCDIILLTELIIDFVNIIHKYVLFNVEVKGKYTSLKGSRYHGWIGKILNYRFNQASIVYQSTITILSLIYEIIVRKAELFKMEQS